MKSRSHLFHGAQCLERSLDGQKSGKSEQIDKKAEFGFPPTRGQSRQSLGPDFRKPNQPILIPDQNLPIRTESFFQIVIPIG
jgi:hypothetical protein